MSGGKIRLEQDFFDEPLRVKLSGVRSWVLLTLVAIIAGNTCSTEATMHGLHEVHRQQLELAKRQLELAQRQHTLDSLRFVQSQNQK